MKFPIHVRTLTGLEPLLAEELKELGAEEIQQGNRVVICRGDLRLLYKANVFCRTAIRVLRPIASFTAGDEKAVYDGVRKLDWGAWLPKGTLAVDAHVYSSFTTHSLYIAQLTKDAIVDQFRENTGYRPSVDTENPDLRIAISLYQNNAQVFVDSSGESLHKRCYRLKSGDAPVRETLAAAIIKLSQWDRTTPLFDPMCGSGTFLIEAGLMLRNIAPGIVRRVYGFQAWRDFDRDLYQSVLTEAKNAIRPKATASISGFDNDPRSVTLARENVERAGLSDLIKIGDGDFFRSEMPSSPGTLIVNPPYDERLAIADSALFYQRIGDRLKQAYGGWKAFILSGNLDAVKFMGLRSSQRIPLYNGAIECRLLKYEMRAKTAGQASAQPRWRTDAALDPRWVQRAEMFGNRLKKNLKSRARLPAHADASRARVYDWDIPELPFTVDVDGTRVILGEIPRNQKLSVVEHRNYLQLMMKTAASALNIPAEHIVLRKAEAE